MMRLLLHLAVVLGVYAGCLVPASGVLPDEVLPDQRLEARARAVSSQLRCPVCRNETIDDSGAPLARDLRILVRERLLAGDSDGQVIDFIVARYGEYVLLKPRFLRSALVLWLSPLLILVPGVIYLLAVLKRKKSVSLAPLTHEEEEQVKAMLYNETGR